MQKTKKKAEPRPPVRALSKNGSDDKDRLKSLELALGQIEKNHGQGSIMRFGEVPSSNIAAIPTGSIGLDLALGVGGLPRGRISEIYGPESSGKTTLALHVVANAQRTGGIAAYIDAEHAMDPVYTRQLGVNLDEMLISQPDSGEQALDITEQLTRSGAVDIIVIDSVAALVPRAEIEGRMGDSFVGLQARLMSQALRKLTGAAAQSRTAIVFINQIREKIGVMFGSNETTPGGRALKFYASARLDMRRIGSIKNGERHIGNRVRVRVVKNKCAPPFQTAEFDLLFGEGINRLGELIDMGVTHSIIVKSGSWMSYDGERIGQGRENARAWLKDHPDVTDQIEAKIMEKISSEVSAPENSPQKEPAAIVEV